MFLGAAAPPPLVVALVFLAVYLAVGIPIQLLRGSLSRNLWGTFAGVVAGLLYITFIVGIYPDVRTNRISGSTHQQVVAKK
ncbi:hypothetical protein YK56LOC_70270 [Caballeronia sp. HLA56]